MKEIKFNQIENVKTGHAQNITAGTGCTVLICEKGAVAGCDIRGGAPGTRETDLLNPVNLIDKIHGLLLAGGSAFGLSAASGIMKYLEEKKIGFDVKLTNVPVVPGAVLFDLTVGDYKIRPDEKMGYEACVNSELNSDVQGNIGAGTGCSIGKFYGMERAMKSGLGSCAFQIGDLKIGAVVAVNCLGNVINSNTGNSIAGLLNENLNEIISTEEEMIKSIKSRTNAFTGNTTIGTVVTNAKLTKSQAAKVASMTHNGYARTIRPVHTMYDGDSIFALSVGEIDADISTVGLAAAVVMEKAVINAVINTAPAYGLRCYSDFLKN